MTLRKISKKRLKKLGGKMPFSSITKKPTPIRKVNPKAKAKRKVAYRKMLSGKEYKAARLEAMARAGDRCEQQVSIGAFGVESGAVELFVRCTRDTDLHAHHLRYPRSRPLEARDLKIVCKPHHEYLESLKMHKTRMF